METDSSKSIEQNIEFPETPKEQNLALNQKGNFILIVGLVLILIVGVVLGGYYFLNIKKSVPINTPIVKQPDLNSSCEYNNLDLCKFLNQQKVARNYTRKSVDQTPNDQGNIFKNVYNYDDKGNQYWLMYRNNEEIEAQLLVDGKHYVKTEGGWIRITDANPKFFFNPLIDKFKDHVEEGKEEEQQSGPKIIKLKYELVGKEDCENIQCFKYKVIDDNRLNDKTRASHIEFIWFDDKDYLLRKNHVNDQPDSTIEFYSYEKVSFPVPSPVIKEMTGREVFQ